MSEPQHPTPFGSRTGKPSGREPDGETLPGQAASSGNPAGSLESIAAVGARLAQLRAAKGWSIDDVSARLKVSPQKVRSLEAGDLSHLPDRTFAAGIVRSYAKMLGADPTPFTQALRRVNGPVEQNLSLPSSGGGGLPRARVSVPLNSSGGRRRSWLWGIAAVIVAMIALAMWHTGGDSATWLARLKASANGAAATASNGLSGSNGASSAAATPDEIAAGNTGEASGAAAAESAAGAQPMPHPLGTNALPNSSSTITAVQGASGAGSSPAGTAPTAKTAADDAASAPAVAGTGSNALEMKVKQDSWLSVRQKDGKEVFSGLVRGGNTQRVEGEAPFKVTIGNLAGLESLTFDDDAVSPAKYAAAKGNVGRFSVP